MQLTTTTTFLALASTLLLPATVSAWSVAFYDSLTSNCLIDGTEAPDYVSYSGSGGFSPGACVIAGDPGFNCQFFTNFGATQSDCTSPQIPPPGSVSISEGTSCTFSVAGGNTCTDFEQGPKCYQPFQGDFGAPMLWNCWDS